MAAGRSATWSSRASDCRHLVVRLLVRPPCGAPRCVVSPLAVAAAAFEIPWDATAVDKRAAVLVVAAGRARPPRTTAALDQDRVQVARARPDLGRINPASEDLDVDRRLRAKPLLPRVRTVLHHALSDGFAAGIKGDKGPALLVLVAGSRHQRVCRNQRHRTVRRLSVYLS